MSYLVSLNIEGVDAATFLQGYLTCDTGSMQSTQGLPMALTDIKGRVIANGWCYGTPSKVTIVFHQTLLQTVKKHLARYMTFAKSKFSESSEELSLVSTAALGEIELKPFGWGLKLAASSESQLSLLTVKHELPIVQDTSSGMFLPQMLNLTKVGAVSFTKGCYLGQEIVARAEHLGDVKRRLFRSTYSGDNLAVGATIEVDEHGKCTVVGIEQKTVLLVGRVLKSDTSTNLQH